MSRPIIQILETDGGRTVTLDGMVIAGPGGEGRVVAEFAADRALLRAALHRMEPQPTLFDGMRA